jgi:hypothetical protein
MSTKVSDPRREAARRSCGLGLFACVVVMAVSASALTIVAAPVEVEAAGWSQAAGPLERPACANVVVSAGA